jgi:hypothetical protein
MDGAGHVGSGKVIGKFRAVERVPLGCAFQQAQQLYRMAFALAREGRADARVLCSVLPEVPGGLRSLAPNRTFVRQGQRRFKRAAVDLAARQRCVVHR